jgi:hypothetical protein
MTGERLAQEAVGLSYLSGHDDWMEDLRNSADTRPHWRKPAPRRRSRVPQRAGHGFYRVRGVIGPKSQFTLTSHFAIRG